MRCRRLIGFVVAAAVLVAGCCIEPPLHLRKTVTTKVVLSTTVNVSVMWQVDWQADTRATDDLVKRLRRKLREQHSAVRVETVWGYGFRIASEGASV